MSRKKMVMAGGTGTIGSYLLDFFKEDFEEIIVLSRSRSSIEKGYRIVNWDAKTQGDWSRELDGAKLVINLAGKSIETRFTEENKQLLYRSRIESTRAIGEAIAQCEQAPELWINASGAAIYPSSFDQPNDERVTAVGKGFKSELSLAWEATAREFKLSRTRLAIVRITPVLTSRDGFLAPLKRITRFGLGGAQGSGEQMVSWIHIEDLARALQFILSKREISGPINLASPNPLTNRALMRTLRKVMNVPLGLPAPTIAIKLGSIFAGIDPSLILESSNVVPGILTDAGFQFKYPELEEALSHLI